MYWLLIIFLFSFLSVISQNGSADEQVIVVSSTPVSMGTYPIDPNIDPKDFITVAKALKAVEGDERDVKTAYYFSNLNYAERTKLNEEFKKLNDGNPLVPEDYTPYSQDTSKDVLFAMLYGPLKTKLAYLKAMIIDSSRYGFGKLLMQILIVEDTYREKLIKEFEKIKSPFNECVENAYEGDFQHFLVDLRQNVRHEETNEELKDDDVQKAVDDLNKERKGKRWNPRDGWEFERDVLNDQLMHQRRKFAQAVIAKYANCNGNELRSDIEIKLEDENVVFGYQSLIDYIQNPHDYIVTRIHETINDTVNDVRGNVIIFVLGYTETPELAKIEEAFVKKYKTSLRTFLKDSSPEDIVYESIARLLSE